jgi:hypothetical protein
VANNKTDDIRAVMMETAKVQLAALNGGIEFWRGWVEGASQFAQAANNELMALSTGSAKADEVLSRITDSSRKYLDAITKLPGKAVARFTADLGRSGSTKSTRRRAARVKA